MMRVCRVRFMVRVMGMVRVMSVMLMVRDMVMVMRMMGVMPVMCCHVTTPPLICHRCPTTDISANR